MTARNGQHGFSLVELMVALVAGMIVAGAVLAFTISSVRSNSEFVTSARLMQELRTISQYLEDELRRAGYDDDAMGYIASSSATAFSKFSPLLVDTSDADANCIIYAYDRSPGTAGQIDLGNQEVRAVRRAEAVIDGVSVGVIEVAESSAGSAPACDGASPDYSKLPVPCAASGWCAFSDPRTIDITAFLVDVDGAGSESHGLQEITSSGYTPMQIREAHVTLTGKLVNDPDTSRTIVSNIKVRANCLRALVSDCSVAPTP